MNERDLVFFIVLFLLVLACHLLIVLALQRYIEDVVKVLLKAIYDQKDNEP